MIQALVLLNYPSYALQRWHGTLIYWLVIVLGVVINWRFARWLPKLEGFLYARHGDTALYTC